MALKDDIEQIYNDYDISESVLEDAKKLLDLEYFMMDRKLPKCTIKPKVSSAGSDIRIEYLKGDNSILLIFKGDDSIVCAGEFENGSSFIGVLKFTKTHLIAIEALIASLETAQR